MKTEMYKPGYEAHRPSIVLSGPEKSVFLQGKHELVQQIHSAMLTLSVQRAPLRLGVKTGSVPAHIVEFGDRVGEEEGHAPRVIFEPTPIQVSGYLTTLGLLEGLSQPWFWTVYLRALHEFAKDSGERGDWSWEKIGRKFGLSASWAESAYTAAIVQAARRSGLLPMVSRDHAVVVAGVWTGPKGWLTHIASAENPRLAIANLKGKSPILLEQAAAVWTIGKPVAQRLAEAARKAIPGLRSHGSWYKAHPDVVIDNLTEIARDIGAEWLIEDFAIGDVPVVVGEGA